jgi:hypothetical protein
MFFGIEQNKAKVSATVGQGTPCFDATVSVLSLNGPCRLLEAGWWLRGTAGFEARPMHWSRRITGEDKVVGFSGLVAGKATLERRLVDGFAVEKLSEPPAGGRSIFA